ncbi:hypothetical protein AF335_27550 [Streptomyces eurocidicus]|uniref:RNA polymerase sigma-70 region 4 domain-containing protein n=1 Tax=Streptomyces eurocidicus TaxID=66423 RepID=A0A2N8NP89_STREU|nr:sigma factor-like helix-turn-helix DNA-binding protein [Streptomyces eurocidicus]MBB5117309.1 hypothetical protein [Streptomyces eurocidicus]PNE30574.1 hypothetical protein AF335_27550 [Streptomyces eurocidicus]
MRERRAARELRRAHEFEEFVGGAGGRLLHVAALLTGEATDGAPGPVGGPHGPGEPVPRRHEAAERLLTAALAATYAAWDRARGEDPYDRARQELATRYARAARRSGSPAPGGVLAPLAPQERLVLVLCLAEGLAEEQTAALLGLPVERVRALRTRAVEVLLGGAPRAGRATAGPWRTRPRRAGS